jgi:sigma-B regulation protein RsbU (phosphoserine phosphatase)
LYPPDSRFCYVGASSGGTPLEGQSLSLLRDQLGHVILGTIFLFFGLTASAIAVIRRHTEVRILIWLGIWSGMYGARLLLEAPAVIAVLPQLPQIGAPYVINGVTYLLVVAALLAWSELTIGKMRLFTRAMIFPGLAIGLAGFGWFVFTGARDKLLFYNNLVAACTLLVLTIVVVVPKLSTKFLIFPNRILTAGTLVFTIEASYTNLSNLLHLPSPSSFAGDIVFAIFLFSFAWVAAQKVFANERRLLSIESELEIARKIQASILPSSVPEVERLRIAASYRPMTAVAGDFYEFIQIDRHRVGILVADVSGHGVPAALIASMIKVAVQSVVSCAHDPAEVLRRLNRLLSGHLREQLVSAAYLWVDMQIARALYSAAGHPPLLCWSGGTLKSIESNGLLFGILADSDYPVSDLPLYQGDRLLLYTDGVVEPENAAGDSFGDRKLEQVVRDNQLRPPLDFSNQLLSEIRGWQPASMTQQDDITLIVIDVV